MVILGAGPGPLYGTLQIGLRHEQRSKPEIASLFGHRSSDSDGHGKGARNRPCSSPGLEYLGPQRAKSCQSCQACPTHAGPLRGQQAKGLQPGVACDARDSVSSPKATSGEPKARGPTPLRRMRCAHAHEGTRHEACSGAARRCWGEGPGRRSLPAAGGPRATSAVVSRASRGRSLAPRCVAATGIASDAGTHARCARFPELRSAGRS